MPNGRFDPLLASISGLDQRFFLSEPVGFLTSSCGGFHSSARELVDGRQLNAWCANRLLCQKENPKVEASDCQKHFGD
jgi:hypothetical protein